MAAAHVEYRCHVSGLALATNNESLEHAFASYGEILDSEVSTDPETGRFLGYGFVTFSSEQSMLDAIENMNGKELDGCNITVKQAESRGGGGGNGGSGSERRDGDVAVPTVATRRWRRQERRVRTWVQTPYGGYFRWEWPRSN